MKLLGAFDPINPGESEIFGMDFAKVALQPGDTITAVAWSLLVAPQTNAGVDPAPQDHITGPASLVGTVTSQRIAGTLPYVLYVVIATATTAMGDTKKLWGYLASFPPGAQIPTPV